MYLNKGVCCAGGGLEMLGNDVMSVYARPCCLLVLSYHENACMGDSLLGGNLRVSATRRAADT